MPTKIQAFASELTKIAIVVVLPPGTAEAAVRLMRRNPRLAMGAGGALVGGMVGDEDKTLTSALVGGALAAGVGPRAMNLGDDLGRKVWKRSILGARRKSLDALKKPGNVGEYKKLQDKYWDLQGRSHEFGGVGKHVGLGAAVLGGGAVGGLGASALGRAVDNYNDPMYQDKTAGPFDEYVSVPQYSEFNPGQVSRTGFVNTVKVPDALKPPRTSSQAPRTVGTFNAQTKAPETQRIEDDRPAPWAPRPTTKPPMVAGTARRPRKPV